MTTRVQLTTKKSVELYQSLFKKKNKKNERKLN